MLPTAFLPVLPKAQYTLHPLDPREIASLTSILREMYLPPVHGGLDASDVFYDDQSNGQETSQETEKQRRFSKGLAESIGTLNLSSDGGGTSALFGRHLRSEDAAGGDGEATPRAGSGTATPIPISRSASRAPYIDGPIHSTSNDGSGGSDTDDSDEDEDEDEEAEADNAHLDPFEREWAQKWLQGVVRRAQTWIEQTGDELGTGEMDDDGYDMKSVEGVLKDSTAVLAVMAGTGGTSIFSPISCAVSAFCSCRNAASRAATNVPSDPQGTAQSSAWARGCFSQADIDSRWQSHATSSIPHLPLHHARSHRPTNVQISSCPIQRQRCLFPRDAHLSRIAHTCQQYYRHQPLSARAIKHRRLRIVEHFDIHVRLCDFGRFIIGFPYRSTHMLTAKQDHKWKEKASKSASAPTPCHPHPPA